LHVATELPTWIVADASRVKQVLHNLLGNAIKFTRSGEVSLSIAVDDRSGQRWLSFVVRDTGCGVPPEMAERIFQPFEQFVPRRVTDGPDAATGLGLGLTISRQLAAAMGGEVVCLQVDGPGACFCFSMPCHVAEPPAKEPCERGDAAVDLRGRVLVVEDNPVNAMIVQAMLERLGLRVDVAPNGQAALDALERAGFCAVLMDCRMPGMDGWQATHEWRQRERARGRARVPIIALTANAVVGDRERCLEAGMDDYLAKPVELPALGETMRRHVGTLLAA